MVQHHQGRRMKQLLGLGITCAVFIFSNAPLAAENKGGRSFEECRDLAVSRGVSIRATGKVFQREYMQRKAAGTKTDPKGLIARCMAGKPI